MKFEKPALSFEQQADRLLERGIQGDRNTIIRRLQSVSYYRLSGYAYPFRIPQDPTSPPQDEAYQSGTQFETIWRRYVFDRRLRLLVMDAVERIEIALRCELAFHHAHFHGPFGYATDPSSRPKMNRKSFGEFYSSLVEELGRSKEVFIKHFYDVYGDSHDAPPVWVTVEVMTFGSLVTFYKGTTHNVKQAVASLFGIPDTVMESWLLSLNTVRNICAHHSRLWNREMGTKPLIPRAKEYPNWHSPIMVENNRLFGILTICKYSLGRIAPQSRWADTLHTLLTEYPDIPLRDMGFPANWESCPIWKNHPVSGTI